jgi:hypothetical protein
MMKLAIDGPFISRQLGTVSSNLLPIKMKALTFLLLCFASVALADDFKTIDGKEYKNATVSRVEPDGIVITFSGGIVKVPFTELSPEIQKKYGYDSQAAADFQKQSYEAGLARAREISEANEKRQQDLASVATPLPAASTPAERQPISTSLRDGALDRNVGPKPEQLPDGTVPSLDKQIRPWLLDPGSLIYDSWSELTVGLSPGGNPAWTVTVTYRAKNAHGAYMGNMTCIYWLREKDGIWMLKP